MHMARWDSDSNVITLHHSLDFHLSCALNTFSSFDNSLAPFPGVILLRLDLSAKSGQSLGTLISSSHAT